MSFEAQVYRRYLQILNDIISPAIFQKSPLVNFPLTIIASELKEAPKLSS